MSIALRIPVGIAVILFAAGCSAAYWQRVAAASGAQSSSPGVNATSQSSGNEVPILDSNGQPVAYVSPENGMTIYFWSGAPVAYVVSGNGTPSVYGFNGQHLGWVVNGKLYDHSGGIVGVFGNSGMLGSVKGIKGIAPIRSIQSIEPGQPIWSISWARVSLQSLLASGAQ